MEDNKLFVFEKKEVLLIFIFVVLIAITAFTLGFRVAKSITREEILSVASVENKNSESFEIKSTTEEAADEISDMKDQKNLLGTSSEESESDSRLNNLEKEFKEVAADSDKKDDIVDAPMLDEAQEAKPIEASNEKNRELSGKYTIQLSSEQNRDAAIEFAEPFRAAGYDVIINSADLEGKGVWYRVSIGAFLTKEEALEYMKNENDLFQGKDYIIKQFK